MTITLLADAQSSSGFDWGQLVLIIVGVLTAFATLFALWQRYKYNPQPAWDAHTSGHVSWGLQGKVAMPATTEVRLTNIGDGNAHNVSVSVEGAAGYPISPEQYVFPIGKFPSGETITFGVILPVSNGEVLFDEQTGTYADDRKIDTSGIRIVVKWSHPPRRTKIRRQSFPLVIDPKYKL